MKRLMSCITAVNVALSVMCFVVYWYTPRTREVVVTVYDGPEYYRVTETNITLYGYIETEEHPIMEFQPDEKDSWIPMVQKKANLYSEAITVCQEGRWVTTINPRPEPPQEPYDLQ